MKKYFLFVLLGVGALSAKAELVLTEQASITELPSDMSDASHVALGDDLTIRYRISQPSADPFGDPDSVVYDSVKLSVMDGTKTLYTNEAEQLTIWSLIGFNGLAVLDFNGPFLDFLVSDSSDVISNGFLLPGLPISDFTTASGSLFTDGETIGYQTNSYTLTGSFDAPVPEPSTYGIFSAGLLLGLAGWSMKRRQRRTT